MAALDLFGDPTLKAIDKHLVIESQQELARGYVGMSAIGGECARKVYFDFHWSSPSSFDASTLKKFADGHNGEDVQAARLRLVPSIKLDTHQPDGQQFGFSDHGGHFKGHMDGAIKGLLQAAKTPHVWEHKQTDTSNFNKLKKLIEKFGEKNALKEWSAVYYGQAILYLFYAKLTRHYMTVATPGGRDTISLRTEPNPKYAKKLIALAADIIASDTPQNIERCSDSPAWYYCKSLCNHAATCHGNQPPLVNCRTCAHSTPHIVDDNPAAWRCHINEEKRLIPENIQRKGCPAHIYNPAFLDNWAEPIGADKKANSIAYMIKKTKRVFTNGSGAGCFTSLEIHKADPSLLGEHNLKAGAAI